MKSYALDGAKQEELAESLAVGYSQEENVYCVGTDADGPIAIICYLPQRKGVWSLGLLRLTTSEKSERF